MVYNQINLNFNPIDAAKEGSITDSVEEYWWPSLHTCQHKCVDITY